MVGELRGGLPEHYVLLARRITRLLSNTRPRENPWMLLGWVVGLSWLSLSLAGTTSDFAEEIVFPEEHDVTDYYGGECIWEGGMGEDGDTATDGIAGKMVPLDIGMNGGTTARTNGTTIGFAPMISGKIQSTSFLLTWRGLLTIG